MRFAWIMGVVVGIGLVACRGGAPGSDGQIDNGRTSVVSMGSRGSMSASSGSNPDSNGSTISNTSGDACGANSGGRTVGTQRSGRGSSAPPASLRMTALRAMQEAPGSSFGVRADGALTARIGSHGDEAQVEVVGQRVEITSADDAFRLGLRTEHVGREDAASAMPRLVATRAEGQEAVLVREGVEERYLAGPLGLEQSYRIDARPPGTGALSIDVAFDGLTPTMTGAEGLVELHDEAGATRAVYRDLSAVDAAGRERVARMEVGAGSVRLIVDDEGAVYPIVIDPLIAKQQGKLTSSDGTAGDQFAVSVSVYGNTAIVGAPYHSAGAGAAYVFVRSGATWTEQAKLMAGGSAGDEYFGASVSVSGETAVIGASHETSATGAAYVFVRTGTSWSEQAKLTASDGVAVDRFGNAVAVSGDTVIVGAWGKAVQTGAAYVFVRTGTSWSQQAKLAASDAAEYDDLGISVSVSGDTAIVGARAKASYTGAAYLFARSGVNWSQQAKLTASDGVEGERFGASVSVSGDTAIVGASSSANNAGAAFLFVRSGTNWSEQAKLTASDGVALDVFGGSVSVSGDTAIVGAAGSANNAGAAYLFLRSGTSWSEQAKLTASDGAQGDFFGSAIGISVDTAIVGAWTNAGLVGAAYVFGFSSDMAKGLGEPCSTATECTSGFCADGVCCDAACAAGPCDACSVAAGASVDGICALLTGPACDDGDPCTLGDMCQSGACASGTAVSCTGAGGGSSTSGSTGAGAGTGGDTSSNTDIDGDMPGESGGCSCRVVKEGDGATRNTPGLALLALAFAQRRRRRRAA